MGFFSSRNEASQSVALNLDGECLPPSNCTELLMPDESNEQLIVGMEKFLRYSEAWYASIQNGKEQLGTLETVLENAIRPGVEQNNSSYKGSNPNTFITQSVSVNLTNFREQAKDDVLRFAKLDSNQEVNQQLQNTKFLGIATALVVLDKIANKQLVTPDNPKPKKPIGQVLVDDKLYINPYHSVFIYELLCKLQLQQIDSFTPGAAAAMVGPASFSEYPEATQRFIASELMRDGKNSYIRKLLTEVSGTEFGMFEYLQSNSHSAKTTQYLGALSMGINVASGIKCPMNPYGICRKFAERVEEKLPDDVKNDINHRGVQVGRSLVQQLESSTRQFTVHELWTMAGEVRSAQPNNVHRSVGKKRSVTVGRAAVRQYDDSAKPVISPETSGPSKTLVSLRGQSEILQTINLDDQSEVSKVAEDIINMGYADEYLRHVSNKSTAIKAVRRGLQIIFTAPIYRNELSITKMANFAGVYSEVDNQRMSVWRYSGNNDTNLEVAGRDSAKLRILFGMQGHGDVRRVEILGIEHKAAIDKRTKHANSIW